MRFDGGFHQIGGGVRDLGRGPFVQIRTNYRLRYRDWIGTIVNRNAAMRANG